MPDAMFSAFALQYASDGLSPDAEGTTLTYVTFPHLKSNAPIRNLFSTSIKTTSSHCLIVCSLTVAAIPTSGEV